MTPFACGRADEKGWEKIDPLGPSRHPRSLGRARATVTAGDVVVSGKVDRGILHTRVQYIQRFEVSSSSPTRTTTTLGWISTQPRAVMEISGHLAKPRDASGTGTRLLLVDSYPFRAAHLVILRCTRDQMSSKPTSEVPDARGNHQYYGCKESDKVRINHHHFELWPHGFPLYVLPT
jgi:hypothetical protein